jgi:uncharacterized membrane protein YdjX (TVP38/TMEM64 family)
MSKIAKVIRWSLIISLVVIAIWFVNTTGIERVRENVEQFGIWTPIVIILLRLISIVIPALPGTAYSILAGGLFGFYKGIIVIVIADLIACLFNFYIAKKYGRGAVQKFVGQKFMEKVDQIGQKYLESNFFLLTGVLMTGLFDFVCYAVGLTQTKWQTFTAALLVSIVISKPPAVAIGAGVFGGGRMLLGLALLGMFSLALLTAWLNRRKNLTSHKD